MNQEIILHHSKIRNGVWALAYTIVAAGVGYIFLTSEAGGRSRWFIGIFFLLILAVPIIEHVRALFDERPQVIVNQEGIFSQQWQREVVPWSKIAMLRLQGLGRLSTKVEVVLKKENQQGDGPQHEVLILNLANLNTNMSAIWQRLHAIHPAEQAIERGRKMEFPE